MTEQPVQPPASRSSAHAATGVDPLRPTQSAAFAEWTRRVQANREQIERLREDVPEADFWASRARGFRPQQQQAPPELPALRELARPGDRWLDIGAGGGRYAIPLAAHVRELLTLDPSPAMRDQLADAAAEAGVSNLRIHAGRWPDAWDRAADEDAAPQLDVTLCCHVLYDQDDLASFLAGMERHSRRLCAVIIGDRAPSSGFEPTWSELHGEPPALLPARTELLACLGALDRPFEVRSFPLPAPPPLEPDEALGQARRLFWVREGTAQEQALRRLLVQHHGTADGRVALPPRLHHTSLVTWAPPAVDPR